MLPDRQWSATQLTSKSDYFIWRKVKWKGKIFALSVEINSDKDQKGRVKWPESDKEREIKIRLLEKLLLILFLVSNVSVHLRFCSVSVIVFHTYRIFIALISDPDLWSVGEQILHSNGKYGMHLNIESRTNNVIDGRHLIINQWWQMCLLFWSGFDLSLVKKTVLLNITANSPDIKFGGLWF